MIRRLRLGLVLAMSVAACDGSLRFDQSDASAPLEAGQQCQGSADCPAATPHCTVDLHCVQCIDSQDCAFPLQCERVRGQCNPRCHDEPDCPSSAPTCDEEHGVCAFCTTSDICASDEPVCDFATGLCKKCTADVQCPLGRPYCDLGSGACLHCRTDADCPSGSRCDGLMHDCV
jgi:hypothetical protein